MTLDSWDEYTGSNFLKVKDVIDENDAFICTEIEEFSDDSDKKPRLTLNKNQKEYSFDLNVTNAKFCKENGMKTPRNLVGAKIFFRKINVISPKTKQEVESLRIKKIEL